MMVHYEHYLEKISLNLNYLLLKTDSIDQQSTYLSNVSPKIKYKLIELNLICPSLYL